MMALVAEINYSEFSRMAIPIIAVAMSMAIPIVAIIVDRFQKRDRMRLVEKAIEHGANLEDLQLEEPEARPRLPYRNGMVCLATGAALFLGQELARERLADSGVEELTLFIMLGGLIVGFVGLALLVNDWMNRDKFNNPAR